MSSRRAKRVRRWLALGAAVAAVGSAAVAVTHYRHAGHETELQALKHDGLTAYAAGDFVTTIARLDPYLAVHDADADALLPFAIARSKVRQPDGQNIRQAMQSLDHLLQSHPHDVAALHAVIDLLPQSGDVDFVDRAINDALADNANDIAAMRARVTVRLRQDRADDALAAALAVAKATPADLDAHVMVLRLMDRTHRPAADLKSYAASQFTESDPRRQLLIATAAVATGDKSAAEAAMTRVTQPVPTDAALVRQAVAVFDLLARPDRSLWLLKLSAKPDNGLANLLAVRLWQAGDAATLAQANTPLDGNDPEQLALRAAALYQTNRPTDAERIVADLSHRTDHVAAAWAAVLRANFTSSAVGDLQRAVDKDPDNAVAQAWLADRLSETVEPVLAMRHWSIAASLEPSWAMPLMGQAEALVATGSAADAVADAQAAFDRGENAVNLIGIRFAAFQQSADIASGKTLLEAIDGIQNAQPGEPRTAAIRLVVLSELGRRDDAIAALRSSTAAASSENTLATVAAAQGLPLPAGQAIDKIVSPESLTIALAKPTRQRGPSTAVADFDQRLHNARVAEAANDPAAASAWQKLIADYPDSIEAHRALLTEAASLTDDRPTRQRSIDRLHALTADDARQWRLAKARLLTDSSDAADASAAVTLLGDLVQEAPRDPAARMELARALVRLGNFDSAIDHLRLAVQTAPRAAEPLARLVVLLRQQNRQTEAADVLRRVAGSVGLTMPQRLTVASLALQAGDTETPISVLDPVRDALPATGRLALAQAFAQAGQADQAAELFDALTADEHATPAALVTAAEFDASRGNVDAGRSLLARLDESTSTLLIRARYESHYGTAATALPLLNRAAEVGGEAGRVTLIDFQARQGDGSAALASAAAAHTALPHSSAITARWIALRIRSVPASDPAARAAIAADVSADASIAKALAADAGGRVLLRSLAANDAHNLADATAWLGEIDAVVPADALAERSAGVAAWAAVGRRFGDSPTLVHAADLADAVLSRQPSDVDLRLLDAGLLQQLNRPQPAEVAFRAVLSARPESPAANNDLACLLLDQHRDLPEAERRARLAVAGAPDRAAFHDTLAHVLTATGHPADARTAFETAIKLDPTLQSAKMGLAGLTQANVRGNGDQ